LDEVYSEFLDEQEEQLEEPQSPTLGFRSPSFDLNIIKQRAAYASIARCLTVSVPSVTSWTCTWCNDGKVPKLIDVRGGITPQSILGWYTGYDQINNRIILVFKSTGGASNWLVDLNSTFISYPACQGCEAHGGFLTVYKDELRPVVIPALIELTEKYPEAKVAILGHSLGGALTVHATSDLHNSVFTMLNFNGVKIYHNTKPNNPYNELSHNEFAELYATAHGLSYDEAKLAVFGPQIADPQSKFDLEFPIFNFGAPRVFNDKAADWFNYQLGGRTKFKRVTHVGDTITHVPTILMGGRHIGMFCLSIVI